MIKIKLWFISWFHSLYPGKYCWASCVSWAYSKRINPFRIQKAGGCQFESIVHPSKTCYCSGWHDGESWERMTKGERRWIKKQSASEMAENN